MRTEHDSELFLAVRSAADSVFEVQLVLDARHRALVDEARELFGASTPGGARAALEAAGRIVHVNAADGLRYAVFDSELQRRSRFYAFQDWSESSEGRNYLWKQDPRSGWWSRIETRSEAGRFVIPREAKGIFKTHCDHVFGGQLWFDVLNQMGGCPAEFVDAVNRGIDQRLQAVGLPRLDEAAAPRLRDLPSPRAERPSSYKRRARRLYREAAALSRVPRRRGSFLASLDAAEVERLRSEAFECLQKMTAKQTDIARAASRPATHHTRAAWGAAPGEPEAAFPRALRRTLLELGVAEETADELIDTAKWQEKKGKDKGKGFKGHQRKGKP